MATQIFFNFHPYLGRWSNLTNIFKMGWNHQLDDDFHPNSCSAVRMWFKVRERPNDNVLHDVSIFFLHSWKRSTYIYIASYSTWSGSLSLGYGITQSLHIKILRSAFKSSKYPEFMVLAKGQYIGHSMDLVWWQPLKTTDKMRHVFFPKIMPSRVSHHWMDLEKSCWCSELSVILQVMSVGFFLI